MIKILLSRKRLCLGILYFVVLFLFSFFYTFYISDDLPQLKSFYRDSAGVIHTVPYSPTEIPPFGTDRGGVNLFWKVIDGAKYTIGTVVIVSTFQLIFAIILGAILSFSLTPIKKTFAKITQILYYIPTVLLIFILMPFTFSNLGGEHQFLELIIR